MHENVIAILVGFVVILAFSVTLFSVYSFGYIAGNASCNISCSSNSSDSVAIFSNVSSMFPIQF